MKIGSLFSGIGGLELGLEWAGVGRTCWQVERDPFCLEILARHWPKALRLDDVHAAGRTTLPRVDLICGGFPCQDVSSAGNRAGLAGSRSGLWREFARVVSEMRPAWVVVENVASGANLWLDAVVRDLEELAYACLPVPLSAAGVGAPHLRRRVFVVARHADQNGEPALPVDGEMAGMCGDAGSSTNANGEPLRNEPGRSSGPRRRDADEPRGDGEEGRSAWPVREWSRRSPEPILRGVDDGLPRRMDRLRALGNAVVPQCAEVVGWIIRELGGVDDRPH